MDDYKRKRVLKALVKQPKLLSPGLHSRDKQYFPRMSFQRLYMEGLIYFNQGDNRVHLTDLGREIATRPGKK